MRILVSLVMVVLMAGFAFAEMAITDMVDMDFNMRPRLVIDGRDFNADTGLSDGGDLRTMIGINVMPNDMVKFRVRFRESRFLGVQPSLGGPTAVFEAQEAYGKLMGLMNDKMCFTVGRFEWEHGRGRLVGATDWSTFGPRTWDGIHVGFKPGYGFWELAVLRTEEAGLVDDNLIIVSGSLFDDAFMPILMFDIDNQDYGLEDLNRVYTFGFFYHRMLGESIAFVMDGAYQMGKMWDNDLGSYMVAADVYYKFNGRMHPYIGVGVDMTSGNANDAVLADDGDATFYNPYRTTHSFHGLMDYFVGDEYLGLNDIIVHLGLKPESGMKFMANFHMFSYANAGLNMDGDEFNALGNEIDLKVVVPRNDNWRCEFGYGLFMPTEDYTWVNGWVDDDGKGRTDSGSWGYIAWILSF